MTRHVREDPYSIVIEYGEGAYGPTIHLDVLEEEPLQSLRTTFVQLSTRVRNNIDLLAEPYVESSGLTQFRLQTATVGEGSTRKGVRLTGRDRSEPSFVWLDDSEGWAQCADLLEALLAAGLPGHQYLAEGDALVEIDFKENR